MVHETAEIADGKRRGMLAGMPDTNQTLCLQSLPTSDLISASSCRRYHRLEIPNEIQEARSSWRPAQHWALSAGLPLNASPLYVFALSLPRVRLEIPYCLSYTAVLLTSLPFESVPLVVTVRILPSADTTMRPLVACREANITRFRIWAPKRYLLNQVHSSINSVAVPHPQ